jgi:hypothetical protein
MTSRINLDPNGITSPSEYDVNYVHLYTNKLDDPIVITKLVNYIEIFESIHTPFITLNVNITDTQSLNSLLPIVGEEYIEIDVRGPDGTTGLIKQGFFIYKLTERMQIADKAFTYTLNCISSAAIIDMNIKISQAISGQPSNLVASKFVEALEINKQVFAYPTKNVVSYISNYWSPLQNIMYLCNRAVSRDTSSPSYVFFETKKSFNFVPLDALVAQDSTWDYMYVPNTHNTDVLNEQSIIHKLYVDETFDYIKRITTGTYGNRSLIVDYLKKSYEYAYYDFLESFNKFNRLNAAPIASNDVLRSVNSVLRTRLAPSLTTSSMPDELTNEWFRQRLTEISTINSQSISIDVAGRFNVYSGNVVNVFVPVTTMPNLETDEVNWKKIVDKSLSGRYLVTSIKHTLTRERHVLSLNLSKDSMFDA